MEIAAASQPPADLTCLRHTAGCTAEQAQQHVEHAGMRYPLLAKPYWTDREGAHGLALVHGRKALAALVAGSSDAGLQLPLTVHQYVDHGGCLFKVGLRH